MKTNLAALLLLLASLVACDPSYRITQNGAEYSGLNSKILIQVSPNKQLSGSSLYTAKIEIYNSDSQPLNVTSIELVVGGQTYHPDAQDKYPQTVAPKSQAVLPAHFKLDTDLRSAFSKGPGELRFRYTGAQSGFAKVILEGH